MVKPKRKKNNPQGNNNNDWRNFVWYFLIVLVALSVFLTYSGSKTQNNVDFSDFLSLLNKGELRSVTLHPNDNIISGMTKDGKLLKSYFVQYDGFVEEIRSQGTNIKVNPANSGWFMSVMVQALLPFLLLILIWWRLMLL